MDILTGFQSSAIDGEGKTVEANETADADASKLSVERIRRDGQKARTELVKLGHPAAASDLAGILGSYFSEEEFAKGFGVVLRTAVRWRKSGKSPRPTFIGRRVFYSREAILDFLRASEIDPRLNPRRRRKHTVNKAAECD